MKRGGRTLAPRSVVPALDRRRRAHVRRGEAARSGGRCSRARSARAGAPSCSPTATARDSCPCRPLRSSANATACAVASRPARRLQPWTTGHGGCATTSRSRGPGSARRAPAHEPYGDAHAVAVLGRVAGLVGDVPVHPHALRPREATMPASLGGTEGPLTLPGPRFGRARAAHGGSARRGRGAGGSPAVRNAVGVGVPREPPPTGRGAPGPRLSFQAELEVGCADALKRGRPPSWRAFQAAFILLNLPGLATRWTCSSSPPAAAVKERPPGRRSFVELLPVDDAIDSLPDVCVGFPRAHVDQERSHIGGPPLRSPFGKGP
jgi:hypothetical protein